MNDLCDRDGAARLATKIQEFWRKRGFDVSVETKDEGFVSTMPEQAGSWTVTGSIKVHLYL